MPNYVALFRGINVGGHHSLPMAELKSIFADLGADNVATYIQSGNVVFQLEQSKSAGFAKSLTDAVNKAKGFAPDVLLLTEADIAKAISNCPFSTDEGKTLHYAFANKKIANIDEKLLEQYKAKTEQVFIKGNVFYLLAPDGIGRSKLAANTEKIIGQSATSRNWNTVNKIQEMLDALT